MTIVHGLPARLTDCINNKIHYKLIYYNITISNPLIPYNLCNRLTKLPHITKDNKYMLYICLVNQRINYH